MTVEVLQVDSLADIAEGLAGERSPRTGIARADEGAGAEPVHPLAEFVDLSTENRPPHWIVPGFIAAGVVVVSGAHGTGKTTATAPLALVVAGIHPPGDPLAPRRWRHVVYIAEDVEQVKRILAGVAQDPALPVSRAQIAERFHLVEAKRMPPERVAEVGQVYRERFSRVVDGVELLPLVVLDTKAAVIALDDENSNSEASRAVAALKQGFAGLPVWVVGHVSKANVGRADVAALSSRGAGALDADATQTLFLVKEADDSRYLVAGKTRFDPRWSELLIEPRRASVQAVDEFGEPETLTLRWSRPMPSPLSRMEARDAAQEAARRESERELREEVLEAVETTARSGNPINRAGLAGKIKRRKAEILGVVDALLAERWLLEVPVPAKLRTHPRRSEFLVRLSPAERDRVVLGGQPVPAEKLVIPPSWRTPASSVPPVGAGSGTIGPSEGCSNHA